MRAMEKHKAHYALQDIKDAVQAAGMDAFTRTAKDNSRKMGLDGRQSIEVVMNLKSSMLDKSMTTNADPSIWQDVYHAPCPNGLTAYIKVTLQAGAVVIQFKEK